MNFSNKSFAECGVSNNMDETFLGTLCQKVKQFYRGSSDNQITHHKATESTSTHLLDLNDDCLQEIFTFLSLTDLCAIVEAGTKSSIRLKEMAFEVFRRSHKTWNFNGKIEATERIFSTFGTLISEVKIDVSPFLPFRKKELIDLIINHCSNLESLQIEHYYIFEADMVRMRPLFKKLKKLSFIYVTIWGRTGKDLFSNCESLVELSIKTIEDNGLICKNTFPKLKMFTYETRGFLNLKDFIPRHKNIQRFNVRSHDNWTTFLPLIAYNCKQLKDLKIRAAGQFDAFKNEMKLESVLAFEHLNKLSIDCYNKNVTNLMKRLSSLKSLEYLSLTSAQGDSEFIPAVARLKKLRWLKLLLCYDLTDLNLLSDLHQLRVLYIIERSANQIIDFDIVHIIKRLVYLNCVFFFVSGFRMDKEAYLRIVRIVGGRSLEPLKMGCLTDDDVADLQDGGNYSHVVQIL